jgi:hypothetical protein
MSLPSEQARALAVARNFIVGICSRKTKRIPTAVREEARCCLKHFPMSYDLPRIVSDELAMGHMAEMEEHYRKLFWEECNNVKVEDA